jgi:CTP synthase
VAKLREIGLSPDVVVCRTEHEIGSDVRQKLSLFCNVPLECIIEFCDVKNTIYECPLMLKSEGLDRVVGDILGIEKPEADLREWRRFVQRVIYPRHRIKIAVVGKYTGLQDAYKSIYESLTHAAAANDVGIETLYVNSEDLNDGNAAEHLMEADGVLIPGGFGDRGIEGKVAAARYARESKIPYLGLCLGMQVATIEIARNVCGMAGANSTEFDPDTPYPVISLLEEQKNVKRKGATMRLGAQSALLTKGTLAHKLYGEEKIRERHRHRYEFNMQFREQLEKKGFVISGTSPDGALVEVIEFKPNPFFVACQFHPEFQSKPNKPHPLFREFIGAAAAESEKKAE